MEYKLKYPIRDKDGREYRKLDVRERIKAGDLLEIDDKENSDLENTIILMTRLCGVPREAIEDLDVEDLSDLGQKVSDLKNIEARQVGEEKRTC